MLELSVLESCEEMREMWRGKGRAETNVQLPVKVTCDINKYTRERETGR